eukprot:10296149-Karenia_brevis.AAC.1
MCTYVCWCLTHPPRVRRCRPSTPCLAGGNAPGPTPFCNPLFICSGGAGLRRHAWLGASPLAQPPLDNSILYVQLEVQAPDAIIRLETWTLMSDPSGYQSPEGG